MISVIVPIYKVEDYLPACIDSILASTYRDFELILVDDGSPDNCGRICDEYAAKDSRIKVIHQENQWVSAARNAGLEVAIGEYISFVDSDDAIDPRMLEVLYDAITSGDYDFSMVDWRYRSDDSATLEKDIDSVQPKTSIINQQDFMMGLSDLSTRTCQYNVVWNKLYKHSRVKGLLFKNFFAQDAEWLARFVLVTNQGIHVEASLYDYTVREGSLLRSNLKTRKLGEVHTFYECLHDTPTDFPQYRALWLKSLYSVLFDCRRVNKGEKRLKEINALARKIYKETKSELLHSNLSWSRKLRILCFYHMPCLYNATIKLRYGMLKG